MLLTHSVLRRHRPLTKLHVHQSISVCGSRATCTHATIPHGRPLGQLFAALLCPGCRLLLLNAWGAVAVATFDFSEVVPLLCAFYAGLFRFFTLYELPIASWDDMGAGEHELWIQVLAHGVL